MKLYIGIIVAATVLMNTSQVTAQKAAPSPWANIDRIGAPTHHHIDVERYRFGRTDMSNKAFYPIPQDTITRDTYMQYLETKDLDSLAASPDRGEQGPRAFLPILAKYVESGEEKWGRATIAMLKHYHTALQKRVAERKWFWDFEVPAMTIPLYRKYLIEGGLMDANDAWFKEMFLYYCRNLHVWDSEPTEWRGGCHRSMPEGLSKLLASRWYPDIPEAKHWQRYGMLVFNDFWKHKEVPQNDTGYMMGPFVMLICLGDQITETTQ